MPGYRNGTDVEARTEPWDLLYREGRTPWESQGVSVLTRKFLRRYARPGKLLEVGCGVGSDAHEIRQEGFDYLGVDLSPTAICCAEQRWRERGVRFLCRDFFRWSPHDAFNVVYDKGFFHNLKGPRRRNAFVRRVAKTLEPAGCWICVCGSADDLASDRPHGAIYLRDLIGPAELYFEVLAVEKARYGLAAEDLDFDAWYAVFRRR